MNFQIKDFCHLVKQTILYKYNSALVKDHYITYNLTLNVGLVISYPIRYSI